jgi:hypothetical protein
MTSKDVDTHHYLNRRLLISRKTFISLTTMQRPGGSSMTECLPGMDRALQKQNKTKKYPAISKSDK